MWSHIHWRQKPNSIVGPLSATRVHATWDKASASACTGCRTSGTVSQSVVPKAVESVCFVYLCCMCSVCAKLCMLAMACCRDWLPEHGSGSLPRRGEPLCVMVMGRSAKWPSMRTTVPSCYQIYHNPPPPRVQQTLCPMNTSVWTVLIWDLIN